MTNRGTTHRRLSAILITACLMASAVGVAEAQTATPVWESGFETGYPGEWLPLSNEEVRFSPDGSELTDRSATWSIVHRDSGEPVFAGDHSYRGWVHGPSADSHRAYPALHADVPSPVVNSFRVWLDADHESMAVTDWIHFGTWGNNEAWIVFTMSMRDRRVEMAHLDWSYVGPEPQPDYPLRRWVRFTVYVDFAGGGDVAVWQDGVLIIRGTFSGSPGDRLLRAHWGMYAWGDVEGSVQYNDSIQLWTLSEPLDSFDSEPPSPYEPGGYIPADPSDSSPIGGDADPNDCDVGHAENHSPWLLLALVSVIGLMATRRRRRRLGGEGSRRQCAERQLEVPAVLPQLRMLPEVSRRVLPGNHRC